MRITVAQLNPIVGDIDGNLTKLVTTLRELKTDTDLVVFPELFLVGYPPRDLLEKPSFIKKVQLALRELTNVSTRYPQLGILVGAPLPTGKAVGHGLYNSAVLIHQGRILATQPKSLLPTYDVFDEARYFDPAPEVQTVSFKGEQLGISICEDAWNIPELWRRRLYSFDPIEILANKGATILINISASPFHVGKEELRFRIVHNHAKRHNLPFIFVNQVGANDELIFDGRSICVDKLGHPIDVAPSFKEYVHTVDTKASGRPNSYVPQDEVESIYEALVLGIRDYMSKCGFSQAVIGLSGGIDSSVVCCLAAAAIGSRNILGVSMPSPYSSQHSIEHARKLAHNLGIQFKVIPITPIYYSYIESLREHLQIGDTIDVTLENIQARIRGNILMALSNKFGYLVLSTGNKSELAVGYCTLYGDLTGGLAVLSDVPKTMVYKLAHYINRETEIIPNEVLTKPPSAELKPNQKDQDTLPPYEILDQILHYYIDEDYSMEDIIKRGFDPTTVKWVIDNINRNEYKRRQAPPGLKVTTKAFGIGRRMPIAAKYEV